MAHEPEHPERPGEKTPKAMALRWLAEKTWGVVKLIFFLALTALAWCWDVFLGFLYGTLFEPLNNDQTRRVWSFGAIWGVILLGVVATCVVFIYDRHVPSSESPGASLVEIAEEAYPDIFIGVEGPCPPACQGVIHESRSGLRGIEQNEVRYVLKQYNEHFATSSGWQKKAQSCYDEHWEDFEVAQRYTMYPAALIAGKALYEGDGCKFVNSYNGDGGVGPMQITHPDDRHIAAVGTMLGTNSAGVKWRESYLHNVLLGTVMLSDFEDMFQSRGVGILAYNRGPGNVKKDMWRSNLIPKGQERRRVISDFRGAIPDGAGKGGKPKIYLDRVLAASLMMQRVADGKDLEPIDDLDLDDIPGSDPSQDGI
mgnify:CR=1 FL=1